MGMISQSQVIKSIRNRRQINRMAVSAKLVLVGLLGLLCLELARSNRVLKESVAHTESAESHSKDGSSIAWAQVTDPGSGKSTSSGSGYGFGSASGTGTGVGIGTGSGSGESIGVGIGVGGDGDPGLGTGTGIGIGIGGGGGTGTGDTPIHEHICNPVSRCNPTNYPPIEIPPVWIPGQCGDQGIVYQPPVCVTSDCHVVRCHQGQSTGASRTKETDEEQSDPVATIP